MTTLGTDIELVAMDGRNAKSVVGLIGGSKDAPVVVENGNLQEDNVLAEFAIDPVDNEDQWVRSILSVQDQMKLRLGGLELANMPSSFFPEQELNTPQAQEFGCEPDLCAWSMAYNTPPDANAVGNLRTCGGHIHVGDKFEDEFEKAMFIQWMDVYLGLPSVVYDRDRHRRRMYGKAGAFRDKPYGVEYRTLSNFRVSNEANIRWVYRQTLKALQRHRQEDLFEVFEEDQVNDIAFTIDDGDADDACELLDALGVEW